ncbi:MAG: ABC transporter ATP-binding protein [Asgard group archaeon]|nr:ABC transporter ATP-binding protein [Asgard group archaeon]
MKKYFIETYNLNKWYDEVMALNNVTLKIDHGIIGLLGPNGAGKTTFLNIATGQLRQSSGEIYIEEQEVWNNAELMQKVGFCPEQEVLFEWMTGRQFIRELGILSGLPREKANQAAIDVIELVGLSEDMDRVIAGYSKGMRQRIKIAQAIVHDPQILFLDEPLQSTDPLVRKELVDLIRTLAKDYNKDILISSHILHEIERITPNILLIYAGKTIAQGTISEIRDLIDQYPHTIQIRTNKRKELAIRLLDCDFVQNMELNRINEDYMTFRISDPDAFYKLILQIAEETEIDIYEMTSPDANLESVFEYLTKGW